MKAPIIAVRPGSPGRFDAGAVRPVIDLVRSGEVVVYPTETFYGLGGNAFSPAAVEKIYALKERDRGKPLSIVVAERAEAEEAASEIPSVFRRLAEAFWPGPLTLVVRAKPVFPEAMLGAGGTVAVRVPGSEWLRSFLADLGLPLTATSANVSGEGEIADPAEVVRCFDGRVAAILDGGRTPGGRPSTVVDVTASPPRILRDGAVPADLLRPFLF
ncbi:MAG: threonylcarbamoyl-AMP synthase [Candidatus Aminicenantes bacterium]|nr:threonylcarbamoyl-AMP synthase [Candidatus Aminicenantes bacterium]